MAAILLDCRDPNLVEEVVPQPLGCDDLAEPEVGECINIGVGKDISIAELAALVAEVVGFEGRFAFNADYPDGTPRKLLDVSVLANLGWKAKTPLPDGIRATYAAYLEEAS